MDSLTQLFNNLQLFGYCSHCEDEKIVEIHSAEQTKSSQVVSNESTEPSVFVPNVDEIDNVSVDLELMRRIEDLNRIANSDRMGNESVHQMTVNYAHILSALDLTIKSMITGKSNSHRFVRSVDFDQRKNQIELLWNNYRQKFPDEHIQMWSSLEAGLADYLVHLKKRDQLHLECQKLRQQNVELKYLLQELL